MNRLFSPFRTVVFVLALISLTAALPAWARHIRHPVYAGSFYPADAPRLKDLIVKQTAAARGSAVKIPSQKSLKALILPHAGYIYSGPVAAHAASALQSGRFDKVMVLAPDHRIGFKNGAVSDVDAYATPLGLVDLHPDAELLRRESNLFRSIPASDAAEHSIEVILPWLQVYLGRFKLVPVVLGPGNTRQLAGAIDPLLNDDTLLVVSSDLSHYLSYQDAVIKDRETIDIILNLESGRLAESSDRACGKVPLMILLDLARRHGWQPLLLHYSNSGDTAGSRDRVVGYAAIAFYGETTMTESETSIKQFSTRQGRTLVRMARRTLNKKLGQPMDNSQVAALDTALADPDFETRYGTFVTLTIKGQLRGCIGSLEPDEAIREGVRKNALNAAFHDPRFPPVTSRELDKIDIEVSVLTRPRILKYTDGKDLAAKLRCGIDGVIIRKGYARATFLPQVWDQLPRPEDFLGHLCRKAGLAADAWQATDLKVMTYQVQYFHEQR